MGKTLATAGGTAGLVTLMAALGWRGLVLAAVLVVAGLGALCWMMANPDRADRFTALVRELREPRPARIPRPRLRPAPAEVTSASVSAGEGC